MFQRRATFGNFRKKATGTVAFTYMLVAIGWVPIIKQAPKNEGPAFPCQDCACSCSSALQCWTSCCCFTRDERIAWAKSNGIEPPDFVLANATSNTASQACCKCGENKKRVERELDYNETSAFSVPKCFQWDTQWIASQTLMVETPLSSVAPDTPPFSESLLSTSNSIPCRRDTPPEPVPILRS